MRKVKKQSSSRFQVLVSFIRTDLTRIWLVAPLTILVCTLIIIIHVSMLQLRERAVHGESNVQLFAMYTACLLYGLISAYYISQITEALRKCVRENTQLKLRQKQLASLITLAADAAHKLATPLGTIAVVLDDLEKQANQNASKRGTLDDLSLIRSELSRCSDILHQMRASSEETLAEIPKELDSSALMSELDRQFSFNLGRKVKSSTVDADMARLIT